MICILARRAGFFCELFVPILFSAIRAGKKYPVHPVNPVKKNWQANKLLYVLRALWFNNKKTKTGMNYS